MMLKMRLKKVNGTLRVIYNYTFLTGNLNIHIHEMLIKMNLCRTFTPQEAVVFVNH